MTHARSLPVPWPRQPRDVSAARSTGTASREKRSRAVVRARREVASDTRFHRRVVLRVESVGTMHRPACTRAIG